MDWEDRQKQLESEQRWHVLGTVLIISISVAFGFLLGVMTCT